MAYRDFAADYNLQVSYSWLCAQGEKLITM